jgi:hypothetical protein
MSESDVEWEAQMEWYEEHANDHVIPEGNKMLSQSESHVFYIHVRLRNSETEYIDANSYIELDHPKLPVFKIVEWFKERYKDVKSFNICYEWRLSLFHGKHLFKVCYTPEEMADYLDIGNEYYILTDLIPDMMANVLEYADSDGNHPLTHNGIEYLVFGYLFSHDILHHRMQHILNFMTEDHEKKKTLFEELLPKAWHPDRALHWCICE